VSAALIITECLRSIELGLAVKPGADAVYFVDDFGTSNTLNLFH